MIPLRNIRRFFYKACRQPLYAFRVFSRRFRAFLYYRFGRGRSSLPEAITFFLTYRCNLRCKMCGQWGESGITKQEPAHQIRKELSSDELKRIIDDVSIFRPSITLFGGEPLLYPHCLDIIRYIKGKKLHCLMITNGYILKEVAEEIVEAGLDELNVSLDGERALHDEIRGMRGLFDKIMEGIKKVNHFKTEKRKRKPFINLQCTITAYNYKHLEQMLEVGEEALADSLTFHNLIFLEKELIEKQKEFDRLLNFSSHNWEGFIFEPGIDPEILYSKIQEIMAVSKKYRFNIDFYPNFSCKGLKEYYENPSFLPKEYSARCLSPWITAYIFPEGEVRPCLNFDYSLGNIRENGFTQIWNGASAIRYRRFLKGKNIFPLCARCTELFRY